MLKLIIFVPETALEKVKAALFAKGAGQDESYAQSCWQVRGHLQFKPLDNSDPTEGKKGEVTITEEYRVEMVCQEKYIAEVIAELKRVHPYEKPAYEIYQLVQHV